MRKRVIKVSAFAITLGTIIVGTFCGMITSKAELVTKSEENEKKIECIIQDEGIGTDETDNLYVELNNKLVEAINDYNNGKITEEEYLNVCESINKQIDSKKEYKELKQSESEFKSEN